MTDHKLVKTHNWVQESGIEIVTGVHIKENQYTGLGLEYDNLENIRDKEEYLKSHTKDESDNIPLEATSSNKKIAELAQTSASKDQTNDEGQSGDEDNSDEEYSGAESYEEEDNSEFDNEYDDSDYEDEKILMLVPSQLILSPDRVRELAEDNKVLRSWLDFEDLSDKDVLHLGLVYLWLIDSQNPWTGYFEYLPKQIDLPFNYNSQKLEDTGFSRLSLHHTAVTKQAEISRKYQQFVDRKLTESMPTFQDWLLPHSWISSRGVTHPITGQTCLVPAIDLCNHSSKRSNCRYDADAEGNFELLLTDPANNVERCELFLSYGDRSTTEFFFNYGFVPDDRNTDDFDEIFRVFDPRDPEIRSTLEAGKVISKYDDLLDFFKASESQQVLRIIRFPKMVESNETKRFRFHNNFVMALACENLLERKGSEGDTWYLNNQEIVPNKVFEMVRDCQDNSITLKARELVARLCDYFESKLDLDSELVSSEILTLAKSEASLYHSCAINSRKLIAESNQ